MEQHYNKFNGKVYNYYDVYTMDGPGAKYIRKFVQQTICIIGIPTFFLNNILKKYIPDNKNYGSWEGFDIFGPDYNIYINIRRKIKKCRKGLKVIEKKFIPIWIEKAYKIDGCMFNKIKQQTLVGKNILQR